MASMDPVSGRPDITASRVGSRTPSSTGGITSHPRLRGSIAPAPVSASSVPRSHDVVHGWHLPRASAEWGQGNRAISRAPNAAPGAGGLAWKLPAQDQPKATERPMIDDVQLAQHIIEFDPANPETYAPWTELSPATLATTHPALQPIPWPEAEAPRPRPLSATPKPASSLPQADCLVVTWTVSEAQALAAVLTPDPPSFLS